MSKSSKSSTETIETLSASVTLLKSQLADQVNLLQKTIDRVDNHDTMLTQMPKPRAKKDPSVPAKLTCQTLFIKEFVEKKKGDKVAAKEAYKTISEAKKLDYKTRAAAFNAANAGAAPVTKPKRSSRSDVDTSASASAKKATKKKNKVGSDSDESASDEESAEPAPPAPKKKVTKKPKEPVAEEAESEESAEPVAAPVKKQGKKPVAPAADDDDEAPAVTKKKPVAGKKNAAAAAAALATLQLSDDASD
jgi:hypothetical protein